MESLGSARGPLTAGQAPPGLVGERLRVHKCDSAGREVARYEGTVVAHDEHGLALLAPWTHGTCSVGLFSFADGDTFLETYYFHRWWNVFEVRAPAGRLRGWYCNIARPARLVGRDLYWEDLALDVIIAPAGQVQVVDRDEFEALRLDEREPEAHAEALKALAEVQALAGQRRPPFAALLDEVDDAPRRAAPGG